MLASGSRYFRARAHTPLPVATKGSALGRDTHETHFRYQQPADSRPKVLRVIYTPVPTVLRFMYTPVPSGTVGTGVYITRNTSGLR